MIRIGLIEDNIDYRGDLALFLRRQGLDVVLESNGRDIDREIQQRPCDVIVVDLGLPYEDGLAIAQRLRRTQPELGIVMLTARGALNDRLVGLKEGADAYLVKPVDFRELTAVLQSLARRLQLDPEGDGHAGCWLLHQASHRLVAPDGTSVRLTSREMTLLAVLAELHPKAAPRDAIAAVVRLQSPDQLDWRRIEVAFSRLRKKLQGVGAEGLILSVRSEGYRFGAPIRFAPE